MTDCECEKKDVSENWLEEDDYGDRFLREESFRIIDKIKRSLTYYGFNENAIFNKKLDESEINNLDLDDVNIDYSYIDKEEIELLEENDLLEETPDQTTVVEETPGQTTFVEETKSPDITIVLGEEIISDQEDEFLTKEELEEILKDE